MPDISPIPRLEPEYQTRQENFVIRADVDPGKRIDRWKPTDGTRLFLTFAPLPCRCCGHAETGEWTEMTWGPHKGWRVA